MRSRLYPHGPPHPLQINSTPSRKTEHEDEDEVGAIRADPADVLSLRAILNARLTYEGPCDFDPDTGSPLNPRGRTGLCGRGLLGKWGPNHAADSIVTRFHPTGGHLQMVVLKYPGRGQQWAIPGGMVEPGEMMSQAVRHYVVAM